MIDAHAQPEFPPPICPRCDYDLSGEVATWKDHCPLASRCPECGLDVRWTTVYRADKPPTWSVEHAETGRRWRRLALVTHAVRSALASFLPGLLWRRLTLGMRVAPRRLALMLAVWFVLGYVACVSLMLASEAVCQHLEQEAVHAMMAVYGRQSWLIPAQSTSVWDSPSQFLFPFFRLPWSTGLPPQPAMLSVLFALTVPPALVLMPFSLRRAKVRPRHLIRLTAYWLVWLLPAAVFPSWTEALYRALNSIDSILQYNPTPRHPRLAQAARDAIEFVSDHSSVLAAAFLFLALAWFWRQAARHYLRLPRPALVALGLVTLSLLLTATIGFFIIPDGDDLVIQIIFEAIGK